jgi:hypothetical protein
MLPLLRARLPLQENIILMNIRRTLLAELESTHA